MTIPSLVHELLSRDEGHRFETKRVSGKMVHKALETICAFSNADGGLLVLGMEDPDKAKGIDRLYGVSENPVAVDELRHKIGSHLLPAIVPPQIFRFATANRAGRLDEICVIQVFSGKKVHSILDDGTWTRAEKQNQQMTAAEITELSYKRGVISAESETVDVSASLLATDMFNQYCSERGLKRGTLEQKLETIGLAKRDRGKYKPTKAAVLLFASAPSDLLALSGTRAGVRVFHYSGVNIDRSEHPNLKKPPKNISGPVYELIENATKYVIDEITVGFVMASGFAAKHRYPKRVIKEAITNAVLHRDYRFPRDVQIRIFDDRIEVESPGEFPANITPATIETAGSSPRNPSLVNHLREFLHPPNVDAGEGVPMMFHEMKEGGLYPPSYSVQHQSAIPTVMVRLLNEERPEAWEMVSAFLDKQGVIKNEDLRKITGLDTLRASRLLKSWTEKGLLTMRGTGKKHVTYHKPNVEPAIDLFSDIPAREKKFIEAAHELGCDENESAFDEIVEKVGKVTTPRQDHKPKTKPKK
jgi:ATP-dependent DNA helicase RecG